MSDGPGRPSSWTSLCQMNQARAPARVPSRNRSTIEREQERSVACRLLGASPRHADPYHLPDALIASRFKVAWQHESTDVGEEEIASSVHRQAPRAAQMRLRRGTAVPRVSRLSRSG